MKIDTRRKKKKRRGVGQLSVSEVMTIIIYFLELSDIPSETEVLETFHALEMLAVHPYTVNSGERISRLFEKKHQLNIF